MSQQDVELIHEFYRRVAQNPSGDFSLFASDVEWHTAQQGPSGGAVLRGVEALRQQWQSVDEAVTEESAFPEHVTDLGDGEVLVLERAVLTGRSSGVRFATRLGYIYTVADRQITRVRCFRDYPEALKAAGLSE